MSKLNDKYVYCTTKDKRIRLNIQHIKSRGYSYKENKIVDESIIEVYQLKHVGNYSIKELNDGVLNNKS